MIFTPWTLFTDLGIIAALLLIGKLLRVYVKLFQKLFIPPSLIAGVLGLAFGPNGLGWLPLSNSLATYPAILIALVFGALPLSSSKIEGKSTFKGLGSTWAYAQLGMLFQWAVMGLIGFTIFKLLWPALNDAFAIMLPTGFYGGHGTAAAIGDSFAKQGWDEAASLGMTTATVGVILSIIVGLALIKIAARKGQTNYIADFDNLPDEMRIGLVPDGCRESSGERTTSSISIESLTFHFALVLIAALGGYLLSKGVKMAFPKLDLPIFSCAFVSGLCFKMAFDHTRVSKYIDTKTVSSISSFCTDLLVTFGVASIKLGVVYKYWLPLTVLIVIGAAVTYFTVFFFGKRLLVKDKFEKTIFAWGWWTGTMAMGIALLRITDPKQESKTMGDFAMAYLPCAPIEIILISLAPVLYSAGQGLWFCLGCLALSLVIIVISRLAGWWKR